LYLYLLILRNTLTNVILGTRITGIRGPQALALAPYCLKSSSPRHFDR
jgi:hypothetical protein